MKNNKKGSIKATEQLMATESQIVEKARQEGAIVLNSPEASFDTDSLQALDTEKIWEMATSMRKDMTDKGRKPLESDMKNKYLELSQRFPSVFAKIYSGENITFLREMLDRIVKIQKGSSTFQAESEAIGQRMAEKFIKK